MSRARHEHQIKLNSYTRNGSNTFENALFGILFRRGNLDLSWLSDDLIAEVRAEMIECEWFRHKLSRENRANHAEAAYLQRQQDLLESGGPDASAYQRDMIDAGRGHLLGAAR